MAESLEKENKRMKVSEQNETQKKCRETRVKTNEDTELKTRQKITLCPGADLDLIGWWCTKLNCIRVLRAKSFSVSGMISCGEYQTSLISWWCKCTSAPWSFNEGLLIMMW